MPAMTMQHLIMRIWHMATNSTPSSTMSTQQSIMLNTIQCITPSILSTQSINNPLAFNVN